MTTVDYVLVGPITADLVPGGRLLGGTVSYAAPVAQALGQRVGLLTSVSHNEPLLASLLPHAEVVVRAAEHTTTFENVYEGQQRTQYIHHTAHKMTPDFLPQAWRDAPLVHLAPLANDVDPSFVEHFEKATILLTPQGYLRKWGDDKRVHFKRWLNRDMLRAVDIVVMSVQDIEASPDLAEDFIGLVPHFILTDGANGGSYYHHGVKAHYDAYPVHETDPTGAGDVFAAGLLASLPHTERDIQAAIRVAAHLAAISVTNKGAGANFTPSDIENALKSAHQG